MPRILTNNIKSPVGTIISRRELNHNTMRREFVFPLIVGVILGALVMILWQFSARLNNQMAAMSQLDQATAQNSQAIASIVTFINNASGQNGTPATGEAQ